MASSAKDCLVKLANANFKRNGAQTASFFFKSPIPDFQITPPSSNISNLSWVITGPMKSTMLRAIAGEYVSIPSSSREYPLITEPSKQLQFLDFKDKSGLDVVHMSARYESLSYKGKLEMSDDVNSVFNYITGLNNYNTQERQIDKSYIEELMKLFNLTHLQLKWINSLSNGQMRRARIAKSLMFKPNLLIIDDPFLGLDPSNTIKVSDALQNVHDHLDIAMVLGLRVQDEPPSWIQKSAYIDDSGLLVEDQESNLEIGHSVEKLKKRNLHLQAQAAPKLTKIEQTHITETPHIEFNNARVKYKELTIFQNFNWKILRGEKWRIMGDNGTGKTTILSLINADHPQSWRSVLSIDGIVRETGSGVTFFDVNNQIGISSPELHALIPQHSKTMLDVIYNGLVPDIGNSNFAYKVNWKNVDKEAKARVEYILNAFKERIDVSGDARFVDLNMTDQKLALFLRAIVKKPEILILDEAFSCMEDEKVMQKCHDFIASDPLFDNMTILSIGHIEWELPRYDYMLKLIGDEERNYEVYKVDRQ